jgi:hypothetical protein
MALVAGELSLAENPLKPMIVRNRSILGFIPLNENCIGQWIYKNQT